MKVKFSFFLAMLFCITTLLFNLFGAENTQNRIIVQFKSDLEQFIANISPDLSGLIAGQGFDANLNDIVAIMTGILPQKGHRLVPDTLVGNSTHHQKDPSVIKKLEKLILYDFKDVLPEQLKTTLSILNANPLVAYAVPDHEIKGCMTPNDPDLGLLWALDSIHTKEVWDITTGKSDVLVAVIDTGICYDHPEFEDLLVPGYDYVNNDADPMDDSAPTYHGTHVAGIISARGNNGIGMSGIGWSFKLMPLKTLDQNISGSVSNAILCIDYAIANGAQIINMSLGLTAYNQALYDGIQRARDAGILVIAAAGNGGADAVGDNNDVTPFYPACFDLDNIIAVASLEQSNLLTSTSNYGAQSVDICAPGVSIYSTTAGGGYRYGTGTSMAVPHVTGAAALLKSFDLNLDYLSIKKLLLDNAAQLPDLQGKVASNGTLQVFKAFTALVTVPLRGDINKDGVTDIVDALQVAQYCVGLENNGFNSPAADFNQDGSVNIVDALMIAQYYVGLIPY